MDVHLVLGISVTLLVVVTFLSLRGRLLRVERKLNLMLRQMGVETAPPLPDEVKEILLDPSRKIEAIKAYRQATGAGLAEAKEAVEAYLHGR
ncbi:MAG TPA: ribosomal protein L7/L12 [Gemmatales bacterium]|nr:ribosomal protein L7/L12 [Gemmatales bacterium]HMP60001.1 ribosomal protein L7/L12 [Gemmatales bacterium]